MYRSHVLVCGGTGCTSSGSEQIIAALKSEIARQRPGQMKSRSSAPAASACAHWAPL